MRCVDPADGEVRRGRMVGRSFGRRAGLLFRLWVPSPRVREPSVTLEIDAPLTRGRHRLLLVQ